MGKITFYAGAGKATLALPEEIFPLEDFTGVQDELAVRVLIWQSGLRTALVSVEMTSLPTDEIAPLQAIVAELIGSFPENIWICPTHTFSAPHIRHEQHLAREEERQKNRLLRQAVQQAVRQAAQLAVQALQPVVIGFAETTCAVNVNRDIETEDGWWIGSNPAGISDKRVSVFTFCTVQGDLLAVLFHYAVQSSVLDGACLPDGTRKVSGDLAGQAMRCIETAYAGKAIAIFGLGAAGDQAPLMQAVYYAEAGENNWLQRGIQQMRELGNSLGQAVLDAIAHSSVPMIDDRLQLCRSEIRLRAQCLPERRALRATRQYVYQPAGDIVLPLEFWQLGNLVLLGVRPELCAVTAQVLHQAMQHRTVLVFTMVNGAAKYMAPKEAYASNKYEAMNSPFAEGSAERLCDGVLKVLHKSQK